MGIDEEKIEPGRVFIYRGPMQWLRLRRGLAVGKIIGVEPGGQVVHVRTYTAGQEDDESPEVDIGHLPLVRSAFVESLVQFRERSSVDPDAWETISQWRMRSKTGEVGAFVTSLWRAEQLARETITEEDARLRPIIYAFPKRREGGDPMTIVEVSVAS